MFHYINRFWISMLNVSGIQKQRTTLSPTRMNELKIQTNICIYFFFIFLLTKKLHSLEVDHEYISIHSRSPKQSQEYHSPVS